MLPVGPDAHRFSPSQNIRVKKRGRTGLVMYITNTPPRRAHNQEWWKADVSFLARFSCIASRLLKHVFVRCRRTSVYSYASRESATGRNGSPAAEAAFGTEARLATRA